MKKILYFIVLLLTLSSVQARDSLFDSLGFNQDEDIPPTVEEAFQITIEAVDANQLLATFHVLEGNYLYRDKIRFEILGDDLTKITDIQLPQGDNKQDEIFGLVQVYHHDTDIPISLARNDTISPTITLKAHFQGCSELFGICYPPTHQVIDVSLPKQAGSNTTPSVPSPAETDIPTSEQNQIINQLEQGNWLTIIFSFLLLGLLLTFTPCVFPMIPILSSIIVGEAGAITTRRAFLLSLVYVLSMSITYTIAGVLTGLLGENIQALLQAPWVIISFSLLFVLLALSMFGLYELQLPQRLQQSVQDFSQKQRGGKLLGVAIMGLLSSLIVGPCLAPPLAGTLIFISQHADPILGGVALFSLSLGMGIPLLIIGTSAGKLLPKAGAWMNTVKAFFGVMLLALAIWMLSRIIPGWTTLLLWGSLLIICGIYLGALQSMPETSNAWKKFFKGIGVISLLYGSLLIIGGSAGNENPLQPLENFKAANQSSESVSHGLNFKQIHDLQELNDELKRTTQPVMLDFYADWCIDCKTMEKTTFADPGVNMALSAYKLLQLDMTDNTQAHKDMLKALRVFGPPTILFFDSNGIEQKQARLIGHISAQQMLAHIQHL